MGYSKTSSRKEVYSEKSLCKKKEVLEIYNPTLHCKGLEEEKQTKHKSGRKKKINIKGEINDI